MTKEEKYLEDINRYLYSLNMIADHISHLQSCADRQTKKLYELFLEYKAYKDECN